MEVCYACSVEGVVTGPSMNDDTYTQWALGKQIGKKEVIYNTCFSLLLKVL